VIITITALKHVVVIGGGNIHISTSPSPYPGDVRRHNHPLLGPSVPAGGLYELVHAPLISGWAMALIPFVISHLNDTQYCSLLAPLNQTSQEVTHPGTTSAEARLTAEF
jgi:hypothetical protein